MKQFILLMLAVLTFAHEVEKVPTQAQLDEDVIQQVNLDYFAPFSTYFRRGSKNENNWSMLISQLKSDHTRIPVSERVEYINQVFQLADNAELDYETVFDLTEYLEKEKEAEPWIAAIENFRYMNVMLSSTASYGLYKKHMEKILMPVYKSLGFSERSGDSSSTKKLRNSVVSCACSIGNKECTKNAVQLYGRWMANPNNNNLIPAYLKQSVMCTAVREGGEEEWDFAFNSYKKSTDSNERKKLIYSLSCTQDASTLKRFLEMSLDVHSEVQDREGSYVFMNVASNPIGQCMAFNFLRNRWNDIQERFTRSSSMSRIISSVSMPFNTQVEFQQLKTFTQNYQESLYTIARHAVNNSLYQAERNVLWMEKNYRQVSGWLSKHYRYNN